MLLSKPSRRDFFWTAAALASAGSAAGAAAGAAGRAAVSELPFRQVHLDFHTSELIPDVGADFNAAEWGATLRKARVNSINIFAKCHHGYAYYDTKIATRHPALKIDLLGEMITACRANGVAPRYYYCLSWDVLQARQHPEWLMEDSKGHKFAGMPESNWPWLCMASPYLDHVAAENREILERYETAGVWFDILMHPDGGCFCQWCRKDRAGLGLGESREEVLRHEKIVCKRVEQRLSELVHARRPGMTIFYNGRVVVGIRDELPNYTHLEIESLATGGWGYTHFQNRVRHMRTLGVQVVGMTGRFHRSWADFGGLKNQAALDYECLNFVVNGAKVNVGDQLHPRGRLDPVTYDRIGKAFRKVEALEPWARGARGVADVGVISAAAADLSMLYNKLPPTDIGFTNMLVELHQQFDILDFEADLKRYKVVIVPDEIPPMPRLVERLSEFIAGGGGLIVTDRSLLAESKAFALDAIGVRYLGPAKFNGEYMLLRKGAFPGIDDTPYFLSRAGSSIAAEPGTEVLATYGHPYFDRSAEHYSSHRQTPLGQRTVEPLITRRGKVFYVANPFFRSYAQDAYGVQKLVIGQMLKALNPEPLLVAPDLPSTAQITLTEQREDGAVRHVVHVLHYPLTRRAQDLDIIEEPGLLENVRVGFRSEKKPRKVTLAPGGEALAFRYEKGYANCVVPRVSGHQAIVFE